MDGRTIKTLAAASAVAALAGVANVGGADEGFFCDYAVFYPQRAEKALVEVYVAVPLGWLTPVEAEGELVYNFNVGVRLSRLNTAGETEVVANRVLARTAPVPDDRDVSSPLSVSQVRVAAPPGDYRLEVGVGDLGGGDTRVSSFDLAVPAPPTDGPFTSDLKLASSVAPVGPEVGGEFVKNGLNVIPNPTKLVSDNDPVLPIYFELYRLPVQAGGKTTFILRYDVSQLSGRRFARVERLLETEAADVIRVETLDLRGIPPGSYVVAIQVETPTGEELATARKEFMVYHHYTSAELVEFKGKFMPYSLEEEKQIRKELALIASGEELAAFDALPAEEKPIFVDNFWARRDPDPGTPENEYKNAFYQRYYYVQERFTTPFREGVNTDMGRVYLKYGEPDEIIRSPMGMRSNVTVDSSTWQSKPFEAWEYFTPGGIDNQYILFIFVDHDGDGAFDIDASSVPGYGRLLRSE
ncbi:MAG: GWxTD domain-containing protein [Candidatus Coatesbacteria bacterium]|nr:MAG: GWxTD domain-containing protein [Candidatus Coatesbacteria bacterium]